MAKRKEWKVVASVRIEKDILTKIKNQFGSLTNFINMMIDVYIKEDKKDS